jgi:hypothetical protein
MDAITYSPSTRDETEPPGSNVGTRRHASRGGVPSGVSKSKQFLSAAPHRRGDSHRLPILGDSAASNIDPIVLQKLDDTLVREGAVRGFAVNQGANSMANRLRRMRAISI